MVSFCSTSAVVVIPLMSLYTGTLKYETATPVVTYRSGSEVHIGVPAESIPGDLEIKLFADL